MSSRTRRKKPVTAGKSPAIASSAAPPVNENTGRNARKQDIGKAIHDAMKAFEQTRQVNWAATDYEAETELNEMMTRYVDGEATREEVKVVYKRWAQSGVTV
jgi:hypothetical protein